MSYYALGLILWELASRKLPYYGSDETVIRTCVKAGEREDIPADTFPSFAKLISRCWAQRAEERLEADEVAEVLLSEAMATLQGPSLQSSGFCYFSQ